MDSRLCSEFRVRLCAGDTSFFCGCFSEYSTAKEYCKTLADNVSALFSKHVFFKEPLGVTAKVFDKDGASVYVRSA